MKSRQDNDLVDRTCVISVEYDSELLRPIRQCVVHKEDEIRQVWSMITTQNMLFCSLLLALLSTLE